MSKTFLVIICGVIVLGAALLLRIHDAPYIAYEANKRADALPGLTAKAAAGDGFAAYLVGEAARMGTSRPADPAEAASWYMKAAASGEIRAVAGFVGVMLGGQQTAVQCGQALELLDLAARAGDTKALVALGYDYEIGICGKADPVRAAGYYAAAAGNDHQFNEWLARITDKMPPADRQAVRPVPFDLSTAEALKRFVAEAPVIFPNVSAR